MNAVPQSQPRSRKFILGLGALMCGLVIYWGGFFSDVTVRRLVPAGLLLLGFILVAPKVGAFLSWFIQKKD